MMPRVLQKVIQERLFKGKAILIFGPRQCGKSTLVEVVLKDKETYILAVMIVMLGMRYQIPVCQL